VMVKDNYLLIQDDNRAIAALAQAVKVDPNNLESLLDLACSYTNELNKFKALTNLKKWLLNHPIYGMQSGIQENETSMNFLKLQDEVIKMVSQDLFSFSSSLNAPINPLKMLISLMHWV
jgi:hypothetical protein